MTIIFESDGNFVTLEKGKHTSKWTKLARFFLNNFLSGVFSADKVTSVPNTKFCKLIKKQKQNIKKTCVFCGIFYVCVTWNYVIWEAKSIFSLKPQTNCCLNCLHNCTLMSVLQGRLLPCLTNVSRIQLLIKSETI